MNAEAPQNEHLVSVKDLAEAVSTQARIANRSWLVLMTVALVVLVPREGSHFELPLDIGEVAAEWFFPVAFLVLSVMLIGFCVAHAQQVRAQTLAQTSVDALAKSATVETLHPRDLFDMLRVPSISRVAPLAQILQGQYQFYPNARECPPWLRRLSAVYYFALKVVASLVYFGLPAAALAHSYHRLALGPPLAYAFGCVGLVAASALLIVTGLEVVYVWHVGRRIWRPAR